MNSNLKELRQKLERKVGEREHVQMELRTVKRQVREGKRNLKASEEAQAILQQVAQRTQEELQYHISELVTLALAIVFDEPYTFKAEFNLRRGKTECDLLFERDGEVFDPISAAGGGVVDIAAFALRVALWNIASPRPRNTLILDEPLRFVSEAYQTQASDMIKEISEKLELQIIMVTHSEELVESADKVFRVQKRKGISHIIENQQLKTI